MAKWLILGATGQLGYDLCRILREGPEEVVPVGHDGVEISNYEQVKRLIEEKRPDIVVNCAAFHDVVECEKDFRRAFDVNAFANLFILRALDEAKLDTKLIYVSTDYVFGKSGKNEPYREYDMVAPVNIYGLSKAMGEMFVKGHYVARVSSLFGISGCRAKSGSNFVKKMINFVKNGGTEIKLPYNIEMSPTYSLDAARLIADLPGNMAGTYHVNNSGGCSWYQFGTVIFKMMGAKVTVTPVAEKLSYRPEFTILDSYRVISRHWTAALEDYLKEEGVI